MKTSFRGNVGGFTLIELLVVVLIIGILSAVALPQYQKTVVKARAAELQTIVRSLLTAQSAFFMANGEYADNLDNLDIGFPFTRSAELAALYADADDVAINGDKYGITIAKPYGSASAFFLSGPYAFKAGFAVSLKGWGNMKSGTIYCMQSDQEVDFCRKFYGATFVERSADGLCHYSMP